ncbi:MAG: TfoX/Sxy family protein [Chloroflexota bacterium]|nr:TfoX/Sxy family protein [Chloroflexota bacterium]MDE2949481.1 TfoX/Sxy family protein [Chloroflexota bacterium]
MREDLLKLKNIGETSADWLIAIGIDSVSQIEELGAAEVYRRLRARFPVSRNMLWALQGALLDIPYNQLPESLKQALLEELRG